jgi:hypothetical protein
MQHPQYAHPTRVNDIGIVFLVQRLRFDANIRPITLPSLELDNYPFSNVQGQILGFGGDAQTPTQQTSSEI